MMSQILTQANSLQD